jgi:hypothetical protein
MHARRKLNINFRRRPHLSLVARPCGGEGLPTALVVFLCTRMDLLILADTMLLRQSER